jgi:hypothetical protein
LDQQLNSGANQLTVGWFQMVGAALATPFSRFERFPSNAGMVRRGRVPLDLNFLFADTSPECAMALTKLIVYILISIKFRWRPEILLIIKSA